MKRLAHTLKGLSGTIGAMELSQTVKKLEESCELENMDAIQEYFASTTLMLNQILVSLKTLQKTEANPPKLKLLDEEIEELIDKLQEELENYNPKAKETLEKLIPSQQMMQHQERLREVAKNIDTYNFEKAYSIMQEF